MITDTKEDYLRALYRLEEKGRPLRVVELAEFLGLAKSTISERLQSLAKYDLIKQKKYANIEFTTKGKKLAAKLTYKHRLIEVFLHDMLKMDVKKIHDEAHRLEHAFSDEAIEKLRKLLKNPKKDPHGKAITSRHA